MRTLLVCLFSVLSTVTFAQQKKAAPVSTVKNCHLPADAEMKNSLPLDEIRSWADESPLKVKCAGGKIYSLQQFTISVIKQNPMQTLDFGQGNGGIPLLARKAIDGMNAKETVLLRNVSATDENGIKHQLSTIVFTVLGEEKNISDSDSLNIQPDSLNKPSK